MSKSIYCPFCHQFTALSNRGEHAHRWLGQCNACQEIVLIDNRTGECYPQPLPEPVDDRIPEPIRLDFIEAKKCFAIGAFRAASVMARRALQSICLDKGAKESEKLQKQVDFLLTKNIITKDLQGWAHEVRLVGNDAAHPKKTSEDEKISEADAKDILQLLGQFAQVLYVAPAIAAQDLGLVTQIDQKIVEDGAKLITV